MRLKTIGFFDGDVLLNASMWKTYTLEQAVENFWRHIEEWADRSFVEEYYIALGPKDSWHYRNTIHPDYKQVASRIDGRKNRLPHFYNLKEYIASLPITSVAEGLEADDLLGHWQTSYSEGVIITVDKDLDQVPGVHFSPRKNKGEGELYNVTEEQANTFFLKQMIMGDPMDRIPGIPSKGPKFAEKVVEEADSISALAVRVQELYKEKFEEDWESHSLQMANFFGFSEFLSNTLTLTSIRRNFFDSSRRYCSTFSVS